jgi:hypothetical protein
MWLKVWLQLYGEETAVLRRKVSLADRGGARTLHQGPEYSFHIYKKGFVHAMQISNV